MSIFEKWFGGNEEGRQGKDDDRENEVENILEKKKEGFSSGVLVKAVNAFIANYQVKIGEEFVEAVIKNAGLSEQEIDDMIVTSNNAALDNGLSISANLAYLDGIREKIVNTIKKMDVGEIIE